MNIKNHTTATRRHICGGVLFAFLLNVVVGPVAPVWAQEVLPLPGSMVMLSSGYQPTLIKGMRVYPENPLRFDFIVDPGDSGLQGEAFKEESSKLMKYFLSSLTVPDKDMWVNLSPYEKDRIIPDAFSKTEMGRDMLGQDYILKQLTASVIYPEHELGKTFWTMAYQKTQEIFGPKNVPVETFNKIWIVPQKAVVYAKDNIAYVVESHLKVMLEEDYLAMAQSSSSALEGDASAKKELSAKDLGKDQKEKNSIISQVIRQVVLPAIEKEVNEGENFAPLRQVYNSLILATWFKRHLKQSLLGQVYVGKNNVEGVQFRGQTDKEKIYESYLEAFHKGAYNYIREEEDSATHEMVPRKYFSGGIIAGDIGKVYSQTSQVASSELTGKTALFAIQLDAAQTAAAAANAAPVVSSSPVVSFRKNSTFGPATTILTGTFNPLPENRTATPAERMLKSAGSREGEIAEFRKTFAPSPEGLGEAEVDAALKALNPFVKYILERYNDFDAVAQEFGEPTAANFDFLSSKFESNRSGVSTQNKQNLLNTTLKVLNQLPQQIISDMIDRVSSNANEFLNKNRLALGLADNPAVTLVINASEVIQRQGENLELDFAEFLSRGNRASRTLAMRYFSTSYLSSENAMDDIREYGKTHESLFIQENAQAVQEILRILSLMSLPDFLYNLRQTASFAKKFWENYLSDLRSDERNEVLVRLIMELVQFPGEEEKLEQRVRAILEFIRLNMPATALKGQANDADVILIMELFQSEELRVALLAAPERIGRLVTNDNFFPPWLVYGVPSDGAIPTSRTRGTGGSNIGYRGYNSDGIYGGGGEGYGYGSDVLEVWGDVVSERDKKSNPNFMENYVAIIANYNRETPGDETLDVAPVEEEKIDGQQWRLRGVAVALLALWPSAIGQDGPLTRLDLPDMSWSAGHVVTQGQDLTHIATAYFGRDPERGGYRGAFRLFSQNIYSFRWVNPDKLAIGQRLNIPGAVNVPLNIYSGQNATWSTLASKYYGDSSQWRRIGYINKHLGIKGPNFKIPAGTTINVPMSQEEYNRWRTNEFYKGGKVTVSDNSSVGGINLDSSGLVIDEQGEKFKFEVPINPQFLQNLQQQPIKGFVPVILNVVPIGNLPQFLGLKKAEEPKDSLAWVN